MLSFLLGIHQVKLLGHMVTLRVTVPGTAGLLPTVAVPFRTHSQQQRVTVPIPVHALVCPVTTATLTVVVKACF